MSRNSLRVRLLIGAVGFIVTALVISAFGLALLFERHVLRWVDGELNGHIEQLIAGLDTTGDETVFVKAQPRDSRFLRPLSGLYWEVAVDPTGPVLRSRSLWDFEIALPKESMIDDTLHHHKVVGPNGSQLYLLQRRIELPERMGRKQARVAVALDMQEVRAAVWTFTAALVPFLLLIGGLLALATWAQVRVGLRPLETVRDRLAAIGSGQARRLEAGFPDEVQPLAAEIDALLDERERQVETARLRAADLAHGLKTPLQVLAGEAERLADKGEAASASTIVEVATVMQRHVDRELARARLASHSSRSAVVSDVRSVADSVVRVMQRTPHGARLHWELDCPEGIYVRIDSSDLAEALGNLVENASRYAKTCIQVSAARSDGHVLVSVKDDGPGIPVDRQDAVLRRGVRLDTGGGAGLGLGIVSDIAAFWGAILSFKTESSSAGPGMFCVQLLIPAALPPQMHD